MTIGIIITSVINTNSSSYYYAPRSLFTAEERYNQTLNTIKTVRSFIPDSDIFLIEGSVIPDEWENKIKCIVNHYINNSNSLSSKKLIDCNLKGAGEAIQIIDTLNYIQDISKEYSHIFKISGRYYLNESFNLNKFLHNKPTFCRGSYGFNLEILSTVLISIPKEHINKFINVLNDFISLCNLYINANNYNIQTLPFYEKYIPRQLGDINIIDHCGVSGLIASYPTSYSC